VDPTALLALNRLDTPPDTPLPVDRRLALPTDKPALYRIRPGDTLITLSRHFGVSTRTLALYNGLEDADQIWAGTRLTIPAGARTACRSLPAVSAGPPQPPVTPAEPESSKPSDSTTASIDVARQRAALDHAATAIRAAEARYHAADFPGALALVGVARHILEPLASSEEEETLAAQASWVSGQALVGLGRSQDAIEEFRVALQSDPSLAETPGLSPKISALVESAKSRLP